MALLQAYTAGRAELARELLEITGTTSEGLSLLANVLWSSAWCDEDALPNELFPSRWKRRMEVVGPAASGTGVERCNEHFRLKITSNWGLDLTQWSGADDYFKALSKKARKNLSWLKNTYPRLGVRYERIRGAAELDRFLAVFRQRWPDSDWEVFTMIVLWPFTPGWKSTG